MDTFRKTDGDDPSAADLEVAKLFDGGGMVCVGRKVSSGRFRGKEVGSPRSCCGVHFWLV